MDLLKVEDVKHPLVVGEYYLVPCVYLEKLDPYVAKPTHWIPVINLLHNDIENGQKYIHYHADYRFDDGRFSIYPRINWDSICRIEYRVMKCVRVVQQLPTDVERISKSKLKHDCIYKGKCPHRGMDLSQVLPENGIIRCPLHSLEFDAVTGKLLNKPERQ